MDAHRKHLGAGVLAGIVGTLLVLVLIMFVVAYSGIYNVSASAGHTAGMRWMLDSTMQSSVRSRAPEEGVITRLEAADVAAGASDYKAMCQHCHGGPGVDPATWSRGMLPQPPHLTRAASEWEPGELFWIVQNGIKYTGMPSFGETHDAPAIRNIVAFVDRLPAMTPAQYKAFGAKESNQPQHGGHHGSNKPSEDGQEDDVATPSADAAPHEVASARVR